jgi:NADH-quinone oxidoreductase subunit E
MKAVLLTENKEIDRIIAKYTAKPGELLSILEEAQKLSKGNFLSEAVLEYIAEKTRLPQSQVFSVATFYAFFNLRPQGEHCLTICRGTACHTRGSKKILDHLIKILDFEEEDLKEQEKVFLTTKDKKFTVRTVACFGQCALAPVIEIDGVIHSRVNEGMLKRLLAQTLKNGKKKK